MVSQLDWEFFQVMRDIESLESATDSSDSEGSGSTFSNSGSVIHRTSRRRILLILAILLLTMICLYMAHLAGILGPVDGQKGLWRGAYRDRAEQYDSLETLHLNQSRLLENTEAERDAWESKAGTYSEDLDSARGSRDEWKSRYWQTEMVLNDTISDKEWLEAELDGVEKERDEWRSQALSTKGSLESLELRYSELEDELAGLRNDLAQTTSDKKVLEVELKDKIAQLIKLQLGLVLMHLEVKEVGRERDEWVSRFHELELSYRDLLCEVKIARLGAERWKELYEGQLDKVDQLLAEVDEWSAKYERLVAENRRLRRLYNGLLERLELLTAERDHWMDAYLDLNRSYNSLAEEIGYWRERCENLTSALDAMQSERDHWMMLYQELSGQHSQCLTQVEYWKNLYISTQSELENALAEIQELSGQLSECQSEVEYWRELYLLTHSELEDALVEIEYWKTLYQDLANISLDLEIGNITVEERQGGKPSIVSADMTVCVSTIDTPIFLFLEFWAEPLDCIWGYGSLVEDVSEWSDNCKTFHVTLDFGTGVGPYKVVATASLRPIEGYDQDEEAGPN